MVFEQEDRLRMACRRSSGWLMAALLVGALAVPLIAGQRTLRIGARDKVTVTVFEVPQLSGIFTVGADGTIEYPQVGLVKAEGLTPRELETQIKQLLSNGFVNNPQVTVDLEQTPTKRFSVTGQVANPGTFAYAGQITLLDAILKAGSTRDDAADEVTIIREPQDGTSGEQVLTVDLYALMNSASNQDNITLQDGDTIKVLKAEPVLVSGYVGSPGPYIVHRGTTVEKAIALAGGLTELGSSGRITITRTINGKKKDVKVKDFKTELVQPGDIINVGRRLA
jgi:polysaccharide export outer membrane protein